MKRADAVKHAQVEWKKRIVDSEEHYVAALKKAEAEQDKGVLIHFSRYKAYKTT